MINFNGTITDQSDQLINNRAFLYGDSVFETLRVIDNKIVFWEDHYFRLMSSTVSYTHLRAHETV